MQSLAVSHRARRMEWQADDPIQAPLEDVEAVMFERGTLEAIPSAMKGIESVTILSITRDGPFIERVMQFRPSLNIPRFAMRVPREHTEWTERMRWNTETHVGEMTITPNMPEAFQRYFRAGGRMILTATDATHTLRRMEAELTVEYGVMAGALAGRLAIGIIKRQFLREGRLFEARAQERAASRGSH